MTWQCGWENAQKECGAVLEPRVILSIYLFQPTYRVGRVQKFFFLTRWSLTISTLYWRIGCSVFSEDTICSGNWAQQRPVFRGCAGARWDQSLSSKTISNREMESLKLNFLLLANWQLPDYYRNVVTNSYQSVILNLIFQLYSYISSVRSDIYFFM